MTSVHVWTQTLTYPEFPTTQPRVRKVKHEILSTVGEWLLWKDCSEQRGCVHLWGHFCFLHNPKMHFRIRVGSPRSPHPSGTSQVAGGRRLGEGGGFAMLRADRCSDRVWPKHPPPEWSDYTLLPPAQHKHTHTIKVMIYVKASAIYIKRLATFYTFYERVPHVLLCVILYQLSSGSETEQTLSVISAISSLCSQLGNMFVKVRGSSPAWIR